MALQETATFLRALRGSFTSIGAVLPTSIYAARAMVAEFARRRGPRAVLEVGPGTGAITAAIVEAMRPGDHLTLVELNEAFVTFLRRRFDTEPLFRRVRDQVTIIHGDVTQLDRGLRFDAIISAVPFTNLPPELIGAILDTYRAVLKPDGTLTYIEYAWFRALKPLAQGDAERARVAAANAVLDDLLAAHEFRRDTVLRNVPPAWIHHLRLHDPPPEAALALAPDERSRRVRVGPAGVSSEALPWAGGLLAAGLLLRRLRPLLWSGAAAAIAFFRDPPRAVVPDEGVAYAACDGRVLAVERVRDARFGEEEWLRIAVFLSLLDVHINRSPIAGKVVQQVRAAGGYAPADSPAAARNHALYTVIDGPRARCVVAQRAGLVARRIVAWARPGALLAQGDRFGLIRFGSRTDVYLPASRFAATVAPGESVIGGVTAIARAVYPAEAAQGD
jgi:phosphatidylserine decarboxylase